MSSTNKLPPMHPGEVLREEFLAPMGLSAYAVAKAIGVTPQHVAAIAREDRNISPEMAARLGRYFFGEVVDGARFWLNLQARYDLERAMEAKGGPIATIQPHPRVSGYA